MKIRTAPTQLFSEDAPSSNYRISMDTKGHINPPSQHKSYFHVIVDAFSHFVVTVPIKSNNASPKLQLKLYYIIGLRNMAHQFTLSLIVGQNM